MSLFPWALIFVGLMIVSVGVFALIGLSLWRRAKALGHDLSVANETVTVVWSGRGGTDRD